MFSTRAGYGFTLRFKCELFFHHFFPMNNRIVDRIFEIIRNNPFLVDDHFIHELPAEHNRMRNRYQNCRLNVQTSLRQKVVTNGACPILWNEMSLLNFQFFFITICICVSFLIQYTNRSGQMVAFFQNRTHFILSSSQSVKFDNWNEINDLFLLVLLLTSQALGKRYKH